MLTIAAILTIILGTVFAVRLVGRGGAEEDPPLRGGPLTGAEVLRVQRALEHYRAGIVRRGTVLALLVGFGFRRDVAEGMLDDATR